MVRSDLFGRAKVLSSLRGPRLHVGPRSRPGSFRAWIVPAPPHLGHPGGKGAERPGCPFDGVGEGAGLRGRSRPMETAAGHLVGTPSHQGAGASRT